MLSLAIRPTRLNAIQQALTGSPQPELRRLKATETEDSVLIVGRVSSFYLKQLAQETAKSVSEGRRVVNRVIVEE